jgi:surface antigen
MFMDRLLIIAPLVALSACAVPDMAPRSDLPSLSELAQSRRFAAWQHALEYNAAGKTTSWSVSSDVRGSIAPIETYFSTTDGWCRDYEEVIADGAKRYQVVGIACRKPDQRWLVLDVRPFIEAAQ